MPRQWLKLNTLPAATVVSMIYLQVKLGARIRHTGKKPEYVKSIYGLAHNGTAYFWNYVPGFWRKPER
jgi:hypothetical protein